MTRLDSPIDDVPLVAALPVVPDRRYLELHLKCAAGTIAGDELAELDLMQAMKVAEYEASQSGHRPTPTIIGGAV